jgi:hypothetical protein
MRRLSPAWIIVAALAATACSKRAAEPTHAQNAPVAPQAEVPKADDAFATLHGSRKMRGIDAPVYVDGVQQGVLRYGELPPIANVGSDTAPEYRLADYLKASGVTLESIKSIHFHDNTDRIGSIEGAELRKDPARFRVHFASGTTGTAETAWDTMGLKNGFIIHEIRKMSVFVAKAVPQIKSGAQCHTLADGSCTDKVPYVDGDAIKGTRVYVDGKLAGFVKRKLLSDSLIVGGSGDDREYSLAKLAASYGADVDGVKTVELVAGDEVIARADDAQWKLHKGEINFTLPKHGHGKVRVHVPADLQATDPKGREDKDALVTSVHLYKGTTAPSHEMVAISEATELSSQVASNAPGTQDDEPEQGR